MSGLLESTSKIDSNAWVVIDELFENIINTKLPTDWFYKGFFRYYIENGLQKKGLQKEICTTGAIIRVYKLLREKIGNFFNHQSVTYKRFSKTSVYGITFTPKVAKLNEKYTEIHKKFLRERQKRRIMRKKQPSEKHDKKKKEQTLQEGETKLHNISQMSSQIEKSEENNKIQSTSNQQDQQMDQEDGQWVVKSVKSKMDRNKKRSFNKQIINKFIGLQSPNQNNQRKVTRLSAKFPQKLQKTENMLFQIAKQSSKPNNQAQDKQMKIQKKQVIKDSPEFYQSLKKLKHQNVELRKQNQQLKTVINYLMKNLVNKGVKEEKFAIPDHYLH